MIRFRRNHLHWVLLKQHLTAVMPLTTISEYVFESEREGDCARGRESECVLYGWHANATAWVRLKPLWLSAMLVRSMIIVWKLECFAVQICGEKCLLNNSNICAVFLQFEAMKVIVVEKWVFMYFSSASSNWSLWLKSKEEFIECSLNIVQF